VGKEIDGISGLQGRFYKREYRNPNSRFESPLVFWQMDPSICSSWVFSLYTSKITICTPYIL